MFFKDFHSNAAEDVKTEFIITEKSKDVYMLTFSVVFNTEREPEPITLTWREEPNEYLGTWEPLGKFCKNFQMTWSKRINFSKISCSEPIMCVYKAGFINGITVALTDTVKASVIKCGIDEYSGEVEFETVLFPEKSGKIKNYSVCIYEDKREVPLRETIKAVNAIWTDGITYSAVPEAVYNPVYSTWYNFHQGISQDKLLDELKLAKEYGLKTLIIDDGWQTDVAGFEYGYSYCGDWKVSEKKFPDMKRFVDDAHKLGIKVILWYSVPFVGVKSKNYEKFKGKYLYHSPSMQASVLDPRYKEVREFLVNIYKNAVISYGLDGFKLDFIDSFALSEESNAYDESTMDASSPEDGVLKLLTEINFTLKELNPDILIEFRQGYIGTEVMRLGNMIRVADCVFDRLSNLVGAVDLRLINFTGAVHSDMLAWNKNDGLDAVAGQLLATAFSVPQISVILSELNETHREYLRNYLNFYVAHKDAMVKGEISVKGAEKNYTQVTSSDEKESVTVCYADGVVDIKENKINYIFNAMCETFLVFRTKEKSKYYSVEIFDEKFKKIKDERFNDFAFYDIPKYGYVCVRPM